MTRYLISFDDGTMTFPEEELPDVTDAAHSVMHEAQVAGVWVFGGGRQPSRRRAWSAPTGRSPTARTQRASSTSAASRSSMCHHAKRR